MAEPIDLSIGVDYIRNVVKRNESLVAVADWLSTVSSTDQAMKESVARRAVADKALAKAEEELIGVIARIAAAKEELASVEQDAKVKAEEITKAAGIEAERIVVAANNQAGKILSDASKQASETVASANKALGPIKDEAAKAVAKMKDAEKKTLALEAKYNELQDKLAETKAAMSKFIG